MNTYSKLYWLTRLDYIQNLFVTAAVLGAIILLIYLFSGGLNDFEKDFTKQWKWARNLAFTLILLGSIIASLIPTKAEAIFILAGGKTIDFIQTDTSIAKIPGTTTQLIETLLEKEVAKLKATK